MFFLGSERTYYAIARPREGVFYVRGEPVAAPVSWFLNRSQAESGNLRRSEPPTPENMEEQLATFSRHGQFYSGKPMLQTSRRRVLLRSGIDIHSQATCI